MDGEASRRFGGAPADGPWRNLALGFAYWLVFLLVLEPGNVLSAGDHGLAWKQEVLRIIAASLLGAAVTPVLFSAVRRWPVEGPQRWRNAGMLAAAGLGCAVALIVLSCLLADRFLPTEHRPLAKALVEELVGNGPLVAFCVLGLMVAAHALRFFGELAEAKRAKTPARAPMLRIPVKERGKVTLVDVGRIDFIETQGNYLALHEGANVHLIRESLGRLEEQLDPARFVRIHRRMIVAVDRIDKITSLGAGDATLRLRDGTELRMSRGFRQRVQTAMG